MLFAQAGKPVLPGLCYRGSRDSAPFTLPPIPFNKRERRPFHLGLKKHRQDACAPGQRLCGFALLVPSESWGTRRRDLNLLKIEILRLAQNDKFLSWGVLQQLPVGDDPCMAQINGRTRGSAPTKLLLVVV